MSRTRTAAVLVLVLASSLPAQPPPLPPIPELPPPPSPAPVAPAAARPRDTSASDAELVERVIEARKQYANSLKALLRYYEAAGDGKRAQWAEDELKQFHRLPHHAYRLDLDGPNA